MQFVFREQPGAGREIYFNVFQLHLKILLLLSSGGDGVGVCCKVVAESLSISSVSLRLMLP